MTDTVVWLACMTQAVTAAYALQMVEQGRLTLDGDLSPILPALSEWK